MKESPRFSIITLGCKVNQYESQKIRDQLKSAGYIEEKFGAPCELSIINSCTVTGTADRKSRQKIRQALRAHPGGAIVATGCAVENHASRIAQIDPRITILHNSDKERIIEALPFIKNLKAPAHGREAPPESRTRALLKIHDGCNQCCSYCIVPSVRGMPRSRPSAEVMHEALALVRQGYREIVLTGIHLGAYGLDLHGRRTLPELLEDLTDSIPGMRIRLSSIEPADFSPELVTLMRQRPQICHHLHLPLQHASPEILRLMGRPYTIEKYRSILSIVKDTLPDAAVTTDIITGFPGEESRHFEELMAFLDEAPFYRIHVFAFSPRPGTKAAAFEETVKNEEKSERSTLLIEKGLQGTRAFCDRFVGRVMSVLVEGGSGGLLHGLTENYLKVFFRGSAHLHNEIVRIMITERQDVTLRGVISDLTPD
jgi:threonylcarbamoyladenosine tRNA methylthiotransferase MtaB